MKENNPQTLVETYLTAFKERDLARCLSSYAEDAIINFIFATYQGRLAIEEWHKERFASDAQLISIEDISVEGNTVMVHVIGTSRKLKFFKIKSVRGTGTFLIHQGWIKKAIFTSRKGVASHMDWQFR